MTLREKIGQRFAVGFSGPVLKPEFLDFLREYKVGNIILFQENIVDHVQLTALCEKLQQEIRRNTGHGAFLTIDQEGGAIVRLTEDCINVPGAMAIAATGERANARLAGRITGRELHALGINFDLAPSMDVNCNPDNPVIGIRSYGDTPQQVGEYAMEMVKGLMEEQVLACAKHFPGHGDTAQDSHLSLPKVDKSREELLQMELAPFRKAVQEGIPAIMTTHILFPALEPDKIPATMSKRIIQGILRKELGFEGLVLSDCMEMGAIRQYYGTVEGCLCALEAGVDIVFVSHHADVAAQAILRIEEAVRSGRLSEENLDQALDRILCWKKEYADTYGPVGECGSQAGREAAYGLLQKTITPVHMPQGKVPKPGENPFFAGCYAFRANLAGNEENHAISFAEEMVKLLGGSNVLTQPDPTRQEIAETLRQAAGHSSIILGTYNGHLKQGQMQLMQALAEQAQQEGIPMVVAALRNPYELIKAPDWVTTLAVWEYSHRSFSVLADVLTGKYIPTGRLPITIEE